jgi:hypothetical protein
MKMFVALALIAVIILVAVGPVLAIAPGPGYGLHISQMAKTCDKASFGQCVASMSRGGGCPCNSCPGSCNQ